jgi:glycerophosphoryl diester phosphodiesterase
MQDTELEGAAVEVRTGRGRSAVALGVRTGLVLAVAAGSTLAGGVAAEAKSTVPTSSSDLQIVGHRGGDDYGTVNSLSTLLHALSISDGIEFDVMFTKDHRTVVLHDALLETTTTNCHGDVANITYAKLRKCKTQDGSRVPNIYEVLKPLAKAHKQAYVHVKVADTQSEANKVIRAINKYHLNDGKTVTTIASNTSILYRLKKAGSHRRGLVFNDPKYWNANYSVLVPYNVTVTPSLVRKAQQNGRFVVGVEGRPISIADVPALHLNGFMAMNLSRALLKLEGALADVNDQLNKLTNPAGSGDTATGTGGA